MIIVYKAEFKNAAKNPYLWVCDYCIDMARHCFAAGELLVDYEKDKTVDKCPTCHRVLYE